MGRSLSFLAILAIFVTGTFSIPQEADPINIEEYETEYDNLPIDCEWGVWGPCGVTCGKGRQVILFQNKILSLCIFCIFNVISKTFLVYFLNSKELLNMKL